MTDHIKIAEAATILDARPDDARIILRFFGVESISGQTEASINPPKLYNKEQVERLAHYRKGFHS